LKIHDVLGREVLRLSQGERTAGSYRVLWDGADAAGEPLASGVYYYRLQAGDHTLTRSLLLLR
jgi:flagellar hook assembly protein FlgD